MRIRPQCREGCGTIKAMEVVEANVGEEVEGMEATGVKSSIVQMQASKDEM